MPLYEYECRKCNEVFEVLQKFSDAPLAFHAGCGGQVKRLLTAPSFQFKGSGWYATDYAKKGGSNGGSNGKQSDSDGTALTGAGKESTKESSSPAKESSSSTSKSDTSKSSTTAPPASPKHS